MVVKALVLTALGFTIGFAQPARAADARQAPVPATLAEADALYYEGNCAGAVSVYRRHYYARETSEEEKDRILFRTSYCYLDLSQYDAAAEGFHAFLKRFPGNEEARLRFAQALFQLKKYEDARDHALAIKEEPYATEATLLAAQAEIELGDTQSAVERLNKARVSDEWRPIFFYWLGVAKAREHDLRIAESYFRYAGSIAPADSWVREESWNWLSQIRSDSAFRGTVVLGYFYDSNLAQQSIVFTDNLGVPLEATPKEESYYGDDGFYVGAELSYRLLQKRKWNLGVFAGGSATHYSDFTSFNNQSLTGGFAGSYEINPKFTAGLTLKYLSSRYDYRYYQDYVIATPGLTFTAHENLFFHFEIPYTWYARTRFSETYGPALSSRYFFRGGSVFGGLSYARTTSEKATYYVVSSLAYVLTGNMFSNYETQGRFLGVTINLPWNLFATVQVSSYLTDYDREDIPSDAVQSAAAARSDDLLTLGADLTWVPYPNTWSLSLAYNYSKNESTGLQGLALANQVSDYNYNRSYVLLSTTLSF